MIPRTFFKPTLVPVTQTDLMWQLVVWAVHSLGMMQMFD